MATLIHLTAPTLAGVDARRVFFSAGRSLTAADFLEQDRYIDARLLGLAAAVTGVIAGLGISPARFDSPNGTTGLNELTIGTGSGIGADGRLVRVTSPFTIAWADLEAAVAGPPGLANGAYLLLVRTAVFDGLEGPLPDPSQRADSDPLLDIRQDSFVEVWLSTSIGPLPTSLTPAGLALALNTLVGGLTAATMAAKVGNGVPLALVLVRNRQAILLSQAAGRLPAMTNGLNAMLSAQVREAFAMALTEPGANPAMASWQTAARPRFHFLPGSGELPLGMLLTPQAVTVSCPFFPSGMAVYLQAIRSSQAPHLLQQALGRPPLNLADNTAEAVTLALAVPDPAWTPDLLDVPRGDPVLAADIHLAYARARAGQIVLREDWIALYGGMSALIAAQPQAVGFLLASDAAARNLSYLLNAGTLTAADLLAAADQAASPSALLAWVVARLATLTADQGTPAPPPVPLPTADAATVANQLAAFGYQVVDPEPAQADPAVASHVPVSSDTVLAPLSPSLPPNSDFVHWSAAIRATTPDPALLQSLIDAGIIGVSADAATRAAAIAALLALPAPGDPRNDDIQPGALLRLAILQLFYAVFVRVALSHEQALDAHSGLLALQRQHLDIMSTSVSALAGGVPPDGSGLSFSRIIPFYRLSDTPPPTTPPPAAPPSALSGTTTIEPALSVSARAAPVTVVRTFSATRATPFSQVLMTSQAQLNPPIVAAAEPALSSSPIAIATGVSRAPFESSIVRTAPIGGLTQSAPVFTNIGSVLGTGSDIARNVATDIGALSQSPPFTYQTVPYGSAAHITPGATLLQTAVTGLMGLRDLAKAAPINIQPPTPVPAQTAGSEAQAYASIVETTRVLLGDINLVETNAIAIESAYFQFRDRIDSLQTRITQLTDAMANARDALRSAQTAAAKLAGDYAAAQQLVLEETARVTAAATARQQAIAAATGLFYVRELQTLTTRALPPALSLAADTPADLVPACPADHAGPPAAIQPFLDLLLEVPLANWLVLRDAWTDLPDSAGLQRLGAVRAARLANWAPSTSFGAGPAASDLAALARTARGVFTPVLQSAVVISRSLAESQQAAFTVFSLPDIITLPPSILRTNAEAVRARLESATGCLFETLTAMPPSARFAWASLARAGNLPALDFAQWPIPPGLGDFGAATLRRLAALVNWMAGQLHSASSAASQTALAHLVTAAVIAAAYGDPDETVTGTVASGGGVPRPGVPIRIILNRPPPIGTLLNLLDANQGVVGTLRVADHDALGTTATVVTSFANTPPTAGWTVAAPGGRAPWLPP